MSRNSKYLIIGFQSNLREIAMGSFKQEMITLLCLVNITLAFSDVSSPRGYVKGSAVDTETSEPLIGVNIVLEGTSRGDATGNDGRFEIDNIPPGIYKLISSYSRLAGYEDVNDAERLSVDPVIRVITGKKDNGKHAASANTIGRFETDILIQRHIHVIGGYCSKCQKKIE